MKNATLAATLIPAAALVLAACGPSPGSADPDAASGAPQPEASFRPEAAGMEAAVVAGHPLAAAAGYEVLRAGGNAVDAAVTMAGVLAVVRPHMNGVGGDAFALFYEADSDGPGRVTALNGTGRSAALATPDFYAAQELEAMPQSGALSVTVPGAVSAWAAALERHGTISLAQALEPAIELAEHGFVVSSTLSEDLRGADRLNEGGRAIFTLHGDPMPEGVVLRNPALAASLRSIAREGPAALYGGAVGRSLADFLQGLGSPLRVEDFANHRADWAESISIPFRGRTVHSMPPSSQGAALLQQLGMAEHLDLGARSWHTADYLHGMVELTKLAFADRDRWIADPDAARVPLEQLLDSDYLRERAGTVGSRAAAEAAPGFDDARAFASRQAEGDGDTVYLMAVDRWGNAVSWIQSLFSSFGSGLVDPATGIVLQNRGGGFTLEADHPNLVAPGKRPFHTLTPAMVLDSEGRFEMAVGTPGGHGQTQTLTQVLHNVFAFGMSPQQAVEAPRYRFEEGVRLLVEDRVPAGVRAELATRGHDVAVRSGWTATFGGAQVIWRQPNGVLRTGADPRREAAARAY